MKNTKKTLGVASMFAAIVIGTAIYMNASQSPTYFKGLSPIDSESDRDEYTGKDEEDRAAVTSEDFSNIKVANKRRIRERTPEEASALQTSTITFSPVASPCTHGAHAIIKHGTISGCARDNEEETCESRGEFTYTGSDRPGLLYGMCITCDTKTFAGNGFRCSEL